ncbi:MAG: cytochrome c5 family protein [Alphaproteobacteria bacterium]|nr:cytochrome c5 family protein [Alphaproteobacteria bacterium]
MSSILKPSVIVVSIAIVTSCGDPAPVETLEAKIARAEALLPPDPNLAEKYGRSCRTCHVNPESGAPLTGDLQAWSARFAQGASTIASNTRDGIRAMPPRGQCFDCSEDDLWRLTLFMAQRADRR